MITCDRSFGNDKTNPLLMNKGNLKAETKKSFQKEVSKLECNEEKHNYDENTNAKYITHRERDVTIIKNKRKKMTLAEIRNNVGKPCSFVQPLNDGFKFKVLENKANVSKLNNSLSHKELDSPMILSRLHGKHPSIPSKPPSVAFMLKYFISDF